MNLNVNEAHYLDDAGLEELWVKIKDYVSAHGGSVDLSDYYTKEQITSMLAAIPSGKDGVGISSIKIVSDELIITLTDSTVINLGNIKGDKGDKGDNGRSISSILKTSTNGLVDTYTITYSDNTTSTYSVTNGSIGADGYSPSAKVEQTTTGATITITDKTGTTTATVTNGSSSGSGDGYSPIANVKQTDTGATITITDKTGTTTASVTNGTNGTNGVSPTITVNSNNTDTTYKLDITDKNGTFTTPNLKGADGSGGGSSGASDVYSDTETVIGTWLGKALYRKVIHINTNMSTNAYHSFAHAISGISFITNVRMIIPFGAAYYSITGAYFDSFYTSASSAATLSSNINSEMAYVVADTAKIHYYLGSNVFEGATEIYVILEYTK